MFLKRSQRLKKGKVSAFRTRKEVLGSGCSLRGSGQGLRPWREEGCHGASHTQSIRLTLLSCYVKNGTCSSYLCDPSGNSGTDKTSALPSSGQLQPPQVHLQVSPVHGQRRGSRLARPGAGKEHTDTRFCLIQDGWVVRHWSRGLWCLHICQKRLRGSSGI